MDPVEKLLDKADNGHLIIKNPNVLRHDYIPDRILHRDKQQELVTQSLIPLYQKSIPPNLLVYGKPGTGKTLVVKKVLKQIQDRVDKNSYQIKITITNAKDQSNLYNVLVDLGRQLGLKSKKHLTTNSGCQAPAYQSAKSLTAYFTSLKKIKSTRFCY